MNDSKSKPTTMSHMKFNPVSFLLDRDINGDCIGSMKKHTIPTTAYVDNRFRVSRNLFYRKNLIGHFGCINAVEFSKDGELLASGGDDRRILVWNFHKAITGNSAPTVLQAEHVSNVFALSFNSDKTKIVSGGNDDQVIVHDLRTSAPLDYFLQEQPVFGVCWDPCNENVFSSACDDGRLLIYDTRDGSDPFCLAKVHSAFHSVEFHPCEPRFLLSGNAKEGAALWDIRMPKRVLIKYGYQRGEQCCMNARFNREGSQVLALRRRLPPILYATHCSSHIFQFNHPSYYNSCTMKSCSFGGSKDQFVMSGSDNFDIYVWEIPREGESAWVKEATVTLRGHRSIVNQVRFNYAHNTIVSSGVEKIIKVWSPFTLPDERGWRNDAAGITSEPARKIFANEDYINLILRSGRNHLNAPNSLDGRNTSEDCSMMAFFDALVQRDIEGLTDEESGDDSTYAHTVYSSASSSDEASGIGLLPSSGTLTSGSDSSSNALRNGEENRVDSGNSNSEQNEEPALVDIEDIPVLNSSDEESDEISSVVNPNRSSADNQPRSGVDPDCDESLVYNGTAEPNTLTKLIMKRELRLRKLASNSNDSNNKRKKRTDSGTCQRFGSDNSSSENDTENVLESQSENLGKPLKLRPGRRKHIPTTPVYESSNQSLRPSEPGPSHQYVSQLISGSTNSAQLSSSNNSFTNDTSSSSSSSNSSSDEVTCSLRSCIGSGSKPEQPSCSRSLTCNSSQRTTTNCLNISSDITDSSDEESTLPKHRKRKRRRKVSGNKRNGQDEAKLSTPSDSGIEMSKASETGLTSCSSFQVSAKSFCIDPDRRACSSSSESENDNK